MDVKNKNSNITRPRMVGTVKNNIGPSLLDPGAVRNIINGNDLDGVHLGLTPWQAGQGALTSTIQRSSPPAAGYDMLYALGADAQDLYLRLAMMQANADNIIPAAGAAIRHRRPRRAFRSSP